MVFAKSGDSSGNKLTEFASYLYDLVLESAQKVAQSFAERPTLSFAAIKQMMSVTLNNGLETQMDLEARCIARMGNSLDGKEGVNAFLAKRKPVFTGQ